MWGGEGGKGGDEKRLSVSSFYCILSHSPYHCQVFAVWRLEPSRPSSPPTGRHRPGSKPSTPQPIGEADEGGEGGVGGASTPPPRSPQPPPQQRTSASSGSFASSPPPSLDVDLLYHPIKADSDDSCSKELQKVSLCGWAGGGGR